MDAEHNASRTGFSPVSSVARTAAMMDAIEEFLADNSAELLEHQIPMFRNHMLALARRIEQNDFVEGLEDVFDEVSETSFHLARSVAHMAYGEGATTIGESEVFLIATHIEVARQAKEV